MRTTSLLTLCVAASLLSCDDAGSGGRCTIVTDGERDTFEHERAHCNGWEHPPFVVANPPKKFNHPYAGRLKLIPCGGGYKPQLRSDTVVVKGCKSARDLCHRMWDERGVTDAKTDPNYRYVAGCQFFE